MALRIKRVQSGTFSHSTTDSSTSKTLIDRQIGFERASNALVYDDAGTIHKFWSDQKSSGVTAGSYGPANNSSPSHGGTFTVPQITVDKQGRVTEAVTRTITLPSNKDTNTAHSHTAGTGLSISGSGGTSGTTTYSLKQATSSELGGIKLGYTESGKNYPVELNSSGQAYVNVPWTNTNYYPTAWAWTNGTTSGPTARLTGNGMSAVSVGAIPAASRTQSGVITTGRQELAGKKVFIQDNSENEQSITIDVSGPSISVYEDTNFNEGYYTEATLLSNCLSVEDTSKSDGPTQYKKEHIRYRSYTLSFPSKTGTMLLNNDLTLNGSNTGLTKTWYAPTSVGSAGQILVSNGSGAPSWKGPLYLHTVVYRHTGYTSPGQYSSSYYNYFTVTILSTIGTKVTSISTLRSIMNLSDYWSVSSGHVTTTTAPATGLTTSGSTNIGIYYITTTGTANALKTLSNTTNFNYYYLSDVYSSTRLSAFDDTVTRIL